MTSRTAAAIELIRTALAATDRLDPVERDAIYAVLVADLRAHRPEADIEQRTAELRRARSKKGGV